MHVVSVDRMDTKLNSLFLTVNHEAIDGRRNLWHDGDHFLAGDDKSIH